MVLLADLPDSIEVTNDLAEPLILEQRRFEPDVATTVDLSTLTPGNASDIWTAIHNASAAGHITTDPVTSALEDGVPSGHTYTGGQQTLGTIQAE